MHGQWSSPTYAVLGGQEQVLFPAGDGWLYSFDPKGENGKSKLLWKFDCNPKESMYSLERATRNHLISTAVVYDGLVYIGVGEDPEHGEGNGHLWCIDPRKRGDVSPELVFNKADPSKPIAYKRLKACEPEKGDFTKPNKNSALIWHYAGEDPSTFEKTMHRTLGTATIKNNLLYIADQSGLFHCLDAKNGKPHWTHDMLAACWSSALIVEDKVYIGDEDGDICIFELSADKNLINEINMGSSVYSTPIVANNVLYIARKDELYAILPGAKTSRAKGTQ
jgi:outer membrane protein assembly factor BamB